MSKAAAKLVIESICENGSKFRPSDWIERISATLGSFGPDHRLHYDKSVHPGFVNGQKCLVVDTELERENPTAYKYILQFAESNHLRRRVEELE